MPMAQYGLKGKNKSCIVQFSMVDVSILHAVTFAQCNGGHHILSMVELHFECSMKEDVLFASKHH